MRACRQRLRQTTSRRWEEAEPHVRSALARDPLNTYVSWAETVAYQKKDHDLPGIVGEPLFADLLYEPRYKAFMGIRIKLPIQPRRRSRR